MKKPFNVLYPLVGIKIIGFDTHTFNIYDIKALDLPKEELDMNLKTHMILSDIDLKSYQLLKQINWHCMISMELNGVELVMMQRILFNVHYNQFLQIESEFMKH